MQSQEFKSDLSSQKGLTNKSQQTPKHFSQSPISKGSFNSVIAKEESEKKQFLTAYIRNTFMRKGSKFEENTLKNDQSNQEYINEFINNINSEKKRKSNNSISISYMLDKSNILQEGGSENKKNQSESKKNQPMKSIKSCDILDSISDIDNSVYYIQNLFPFQGQSPIFQQEYQENRNFQSQSSSVSSTVYSSSTPKDGKNLKQKTPIKIFTSPQIIENNNYQDQRQISELPQNKNKQVDQFNEYQQQQQHQNDIYFSQKQIFNMNTNISTTAQQSHQNKDNSQYAFESGRNNSFHNISYLILNDTQRLLATNNREDLDISRQNQDLNNVTFNFELQNDQEQNPFDSQKINSQDQPMLIEEKSSLEVKKDFPINVKKNQSTEVKMNKESPKKKLFIQISHNENEQDGQDMDILIQQNSEDHLFQKQNKIKNKLQQYFSKKKCKCNEVLVVDDNQFNLLVMIKLLQSYSIIADQAFDGQKALDLVIEKTKNQCCPHFKLILMDIDMPIMNGYQSTQSILDFYKQKHPNINPPIISACTAFVSNEDKAQAKKRGMKFFIGKPIQVFHLDFVLEQSLLKKKK